MRYCFLDNLRGLVFISMALFHTMWDLTALFGWDAPWFSGIPGYVWQIDIGPALFFAAHSGVADAPLLYHLLIPSRFSGVLPRRRTR